MTSDDFRNLDMNVHAWISLESPTLPAFVREVPDLEAKGPGVMLRCTSFSVTPVGVEFLFFAVAEGDGSRIIERRPPRVPRHTSDVDRLSMWICDPSPRDVWVSTSKISRLYREDGTPENRFRHVVALGFGLDLDRVNADVSLHLRWGRLEPVEHRLVLPATQLRAAAKSMVSWNMI
jgi:hypothetical protein